MSVNPKHLPEVGGRRLDCSNSFFEQRCRVYLSQEQEKVAPDNGLIAILCDSVRLAREYADYVKDHVGSRVPDEITSQKANPKIKS